MNSMLGRLERLSPGISRHVPEMPPTDLMLEETAGMFESELLDRSTTLGHLEALIAAWRSDGMAHFDAGELASEMVVCEFADAVTVRPPEEVTFVSFGAAAPRMVSDPVVRIEGFYVREVVADGTFAAEITIVCAEDSWEDFDSMRYSDAIRVASRAAIGVIQLDEITSSAEIIASFVGDQDLLEDPSLKKAWEIASYAMATELGIAPSLGVSYGGLNDSTVDGNARACRY